ncbi:MAG: potassium channel family protein [Verrucomicrobiales bacterium]
MFFNLIKQLLRETNATLPGRLSLALLGALVLNLLFGLAFYLAERDLQELSFTDSVWWAMVTMTTVGYGDFYPQSFTGRFFIAYPCFLLGIGLIGYLLGVVAESLISFTNRKRKGHLKCHMKNHIIICHYPSETKILHIVQELRAVPSQAETPIVVVTEKLEEAPPSFTKHKIRFVQGDPSDDRILEKAAIGQAQGVLILAQDPTNPASDARTFAVGTIIEHLEREYERPIKTITEMVSARSTRMTKHSSIDGSIVAEGISDRVMVQEFLHPGIHQTYQELLSNTHGSQLYLADTKLEGRKLQDIQLAALRDPACLQIIGLKRNDKQFLNLPADTQIQAGDQLIVLTSSQQTYYDFERQFLASN